MLEGLDILKSFSDLIGNGTRGLPGCSIVPQRPPIPNGFRHIAISLHSSKTVDKKGILVLFLIPAFIVQATKSVQIT
jgi:hypothetical protein